MPRCLQAWASWKQKLIVRMFCSIDSVLWLLNTYLKYQQNLLLCFDIWTSYIMSDMYLDSHTSTCQSWKIKDLFFSENCFVPVSKYQVAMVTATLVNRATLPPYRSKSNTKGRQNRLGIGNKRAWGKIPTMKEISLFQIEMEVVEGGSMLPQTKSKQKVGSLEGWTVSSYARASQRDCVFWAQENAAFIPNGHWVPPGPVLRKASSRMLYAHTFILPLPHSVLPHFCETDHWPVMEWGCHSYFVP